MVTNDQTLREAEVSRSNQAKQILENKIFVEAIDTLKKLYSEALLEKTGAKESDTREKLWIAYNVVGKVEQHLQTVIETGKLAEKQLEDFRKQQVKTKF
jgi:hypothetical protein